MADKSRPASEPQASANWLALRTRAPLAMAAPDAPPSVKDEAQWQSLKRHQKMDTSATQPFNAGWARISWTPSALAVDWIFASTEARNAAKQLNQPTHLLGDVGEFFLQWPGADRYIEIHVTPENRRLQLTWTAEALAAVRKGTQKLEDRAVADPNWVQSVAKVAPTFWSARLIVSPAVVAPELKEFRTGLELRASVCRYDYSGGTPPVLSSIVDHGVGRFHDREAWGRLCLA